MEKLKIEKHSKTNDSVTRTIRISGLTFDKILAFKPVSLKSDALISEKYILLISIFSL